MATDLLLPDLRPLTASERRRQLWRYTWQSRRTQILGAAFGVLIVALAVILVPRLRPPSTILPAAPDWLSWQDNLQTLFGLATLLVAVFVWLDELNEEWSEDLPRLLSFFFFFQGQPALVCYHAYLAGESDIRAWAQQIGGRQMTGGDLHFRPVVDSRPVEYLTDGANVYLHHQVRFTLTDLPNLLAETAQATGHPVCLVWRPRREEKPPQQSAAIPSRDALCLSGASGWDTPTA